MFFGDKTTNNEDIYRILKRFYVNCTIVQLIKVIKPNETRLTPKNI